jgi:hypothetical protein
MKRMLTGGIPLPALKTWSGSSPNMLIEIILFSNIHHFYYNVKGGNFLKKRK